VELGIHLPRQWQDAFVRDYKYPKPLVADPLPERRLTRLLAAFVASGLFFMVLPGVVLAVGNLIGVSALQGTESIPAAWIQANGHARLFGWVGSFLIGICLYAVPKCLGGLPGSRRVGWTMWALWSGAVLGHWAVGMRPWHWKAVLVASSLVELLVAILLVWQICGPGRVRFRKQLWSRLVLTGLTGFVAVLAVQLAMAWHLRDAPVFPPAQDRLLLWLTLWSFAFPAAWGFSARYLPSFLGSEPPEEEAAYAALAILGIANIAAVAELNRVAVAMILIVVLLGCWSLRIFHTANGRPELAGAKPSYAWLVRVAFLWLVESALLPILGDSAGWLGASRHAFAVGFLGTLIFAMGPIVLPSYLSRRELWSERLALAAPAMLNAGCILRVISEPVAYGKTFPLAWHLLPVAAALEVAGVLAFAYNIGRTLATPVLTWIDDSAIDENLKLYWCVASYPETRRLLRQAGIETLGRVESIPWSLTLREAAEADGADWRRLAGLLKKHFDTRIARALKAS
jgi:hypothetical protein